MANINVNDLSDLNLAGAELFNDSESLMTELSDESEQMEVIGGAAALSEPELQNIIIGCLLPTCLDTGAVGSGTVIIVYAV